MGMFCIGSRKRHAPFDPLRNKVNKLVKGEMKRKMNEPTTLTKRISVFKLIIPIVCLVFFIIQTSSRVKYYYTYPTANNIIVTENLTINFPRIIICHEPYKLRMKHIKKHITKKNDGCGVDMLELLGKKKYLTADFIWNNSGNKPARASSEYIAQNFGLKSPNYILADVKLVDGICNEIISSPYRYLGTNTIIILAFVAVSSICSLMDKVYTVAKGEPVDYSSFEYLPNEMILGMGIRATKIERLSTPTNPCMETDQFHKCKKKCLEEKLKNIINCSLPTILDEELPFCKTPETGKFTRTSFLKVSMETNPVIDCPCQRRCDETHYDKILETIEYVGKLTLIGFYFPTSFIETIKEVRTYDFMKLLCDIGGNLGLAMGMSLLSSIDQIENIFIYFIKFIRIICRGKC